MVATAVNSKRCTKCGEVKALSEFRKNSNGRGLFGRRGQCKACESAFNREYMQRWSAKRYDRLRFHAENFGMHIVDRNRHNTLRRVVKYQTKLKIENPEKLRSQWRKQSEKSNRKPETIERKRKWHQLNKNRRNAKSRSNYHANPQKWNALSRANYLANKTKRQEQKRAYQIANRDKLKAKRKEWYLQNREYCIQDRLKRKRAIRRQMQADKAIAMLVAASKLSKL